MSTQQTFTKDNIIVKDVDGIERECNISRESLEELISNARLVLDDEEEEE